jgi:isopentenyldiphosphate isomerase
VLAFDGAGRVFLQKRSRKKDVAPGLWDSSCSGHLHSGEAYDAAAVRELGEELGLGPEVRPARWYRIEACDQTGWEFVWVYRLSHGGPFVLNTDEIEGGEWRDPRDLGRRIALEPAAYSRAFRHIWSRAPSA